MALYFVQHGVAVASEEDPQRPLTKAGKRDAVAMASHLQARGIHPSRIVHSGKLRAQQTAELMARELEVVKVETAAGMAPKDDAAAFAAGIKADDSMYIGHLPHLQKLVSWLVAGDADAEIIRFRNTGVVCLEPGDNHFEVAWYLVPALC